MKLLRITIITILFVLIELLLINYIYYSDLVFTISLVLLFAETFYIGYVIEQPVFKKRKI